MKKVNGFSISVKKESPGLLVMGIFQESQLKDKYVTNKMEKE